MFFFVITRKKKTIKTVLCTRVCVCVGSSIKQNYHIRIIIRNKFGDFAVRECAVVLFFYISNIKSLLNKMERERETLQKMYAEAK